MAAFIRELRYSVKLSLYGQQMAAPSAIAELMQDLGDALNNNPHLLFLGGGNPAIIPAASAIFQQHITALCHDEQAVQKWLGVYQSPQGSEPLLEAAAQYLQGQGWPVTTANLVVVNGGQTACHRLFNLFGGATASGQKAYIHLPLVPEYVGYRGQTIGGDAFVVTRPLINELSANRFSYQLNKEAFALNLQSGGVCLSRPTNPSAMVMPLEDLAWLLAQTQAANIPLITDSAYGAPFPGIMAAEQSFAWRPGMVTVLSASKLGLPGLRTAIVVADAPVVALLTRAGAIENLAAGNTGAMLLERLLVSGDMPRLTAAVAAFYANKRQTMLQLLDAALDGTAYKIHQPDGAFFVWLWLPELPISSSLLYQRLKERGVLVMAGEGFFFGEETHWRHARECLRLNICQSDEVMTQAVGIIAEEIKRAYGQR